MANVYITKPLRQFTNNDSHITIDADSYLNLYTNLVNIYPDLRKCVKDVYDTKSFDFWFIVNGKILPYEEFLLPVRKDALVVFVPLIFGSGEDVLAIGIGLALIAITIVTFGTAAPLTALAATAGGLAGASAGAIAGAVVGQLAFSLGLSLVLSGVMSIVAGAQQSKNSNVNDSSVRSDNDGFNSLQNTTQIGTPIPLIFGQMRISGQFVGGRIKTINHTSSDVISLANYTV